MSTEVALKASNVGELFISRGRPPQDNHHRQTNTKLITVWMPFLSPNKQCQSTDGKLLYDITHNIHSAVRKQSAIVYCTDSNRTGCARGNTTCPAPLLPRHAPPSRRNVAVLSHAEYVSTFTAAAALRVKAAVGKAAWWPFDLESGVPVTCANFGLPRPLCFWLRPDVLDRRTSDVREKHRLMPPPIRGGA